MLLVPGSRSTVGVKRATDPDSDGDPDADADNAGATPDIEVYNNTSVTTLTTDDDGKVTFVVDAPEDDDDKNDAHDTPEVTRITGRSRNCWRTCDSDRKAREPGRHDHLHL